MSTNGLVSVMRGGKVICKVIAGCNSHNASLMARWLLNHAGPKTSPGLIASAALELCKFGCESDIVVQWKRADNERHFSYGWNENLSVGSVVELKDKDEDSEIYNSIGAFADPLFNPRWERGTADTIRIVNVDDISMLDDGGIEDGNNPVIRLKYSPLKYICVKENPVIPRDEQKNVLDMFWQLLSDCESRAWSNDDAVLKHMVTSGYDLLNRLRYTAERPRLEKNPTKPA